MIICANECMSDHYDNLIPANINTLVNNNPHL